MENQLEQARSRMSENLTAQLRKAQAEVARTLARIRGEEDQEDYPEREFSGVSLEQQASIDQEKAEVAELERQAQKAPAPEGGRSERGRSWTTKRRFRGGP